MPQVCIPGNSRHNFARGNRSKTLTGNLTLTGADTFYQFINPNGTARTVTLPALTQSFGLGFEINNTDTVSQLTIANAAAATICVLAAGQTVEVSCDGATWSISEAGAVMPTGIIFQDFTAHNSAQGTNEVFSTYSLPAGVLGAVGRTIRVHWFGTTAANGNSKLTRLAFGAASVSMTTGAIAANNKDWEMTATITATGAATQVIDPSGSTFNGIRLAITGALTATETASGALTIATQNTAATAASDIVQLGMTVEVLR